MFAGQVMVSVGAGVGPVTVTVKLQLFVWPSCDCAFACTVVVPTEKLLPDCGVTVNVTGGFPPDVVTV